MASQGSLGAVLIIDDDEIHHEVVSSALHRYEFSEVLHAYNGEQARALVRSQLDRIDLILCDLYMPQFDGIEFLLSFNDLDCDVPVLFISGAKIEVLHSARLLANAHDIKLVDTIRKPLNFEIFHELIANFKAQALSRAGDTEGTKSPTR